MPCQPSEEAQRAGTQPLPPDTLGAGVQRSADDGGASGWICPGWRSQDWSTEAGVGQHATGYVAESYHDIANEENAAPQTDAATSPAEVGGSRGGLGQGPGGQGPGGQGPGAQASGGQASGGQALSKEPLTPLEQGPGDQGIRGQGTREPLTPDELARLCTPPSPPPPPRSPRLASPPPCLLSPDAPPRPPRPPPPAPPRLPLHSPAPQSSAPSLEPVVAGSPIDSITIPHATPHDEVFDGTHHGALNTSASGVALGEALGETASGRALPTDVGQARGAGGAGGGGEGHGGGSDGGGKEAPTRQLWLPALIALAVGISVMVLRGKRGKQDGRLRRAGGISYAPPAHAQAADARTHTFSEDAFNESIGLDEAAGIALIEPPTPSPPSHRHDGTARGGGDHDGAHGGAHGGSGDGGGSGGRPAIRPCGSSGSGTGYLGRVGSRAHEAVPLQAAGGEEEDAIASAAALRALRARPKEGGRVQSRPEVVRGAWDEDDEPWL